MEQTALSRKIPEPKIESEGKYTRERNQLFLLNGDILQQEGFTF